MVRVNIDTDAELYPAVHASVASHPSETYVEVPDDLWQRPTQAQILARMLARRANRTQPN